jgi:hypothetical protein
MYYISPTPDIALHSFIDSVKDSHSVRVAFLASNHIFWDSTPCNLAEFTEVQGDRSTAIFRIEK